MLINTYFKYTVVGYNLHIIRTTVDSQSF